VLARRIVTYEPNLTLFLPVWNDVKNTVQERDHLAFDNKRILPFYSLSGE
jgi:hypothetical protein